MNEQRLLTISRRLHRAAEDRDIAINNPGFMIAPQIGDKPPVFKPFTSDRHKRRIALRKVRVGMLLYALQLECNEDPIQGLKNSIRAARVPSQVRA